MKELLRIWRRSPGAMVVYLLLFLAILGGTVYALVWHVPNTRVTIRVATPPSAEEKVSNKDITSAIEDISEQLEKKDESNDKVEKLKQKLDKTRKKQGKLKKHVASFNSALDAEDWQKELNEVEVDSETFTEIKTLKGNLRKLKKSLETTREELKKKQEVLESERKKKKQIRSEFKGVKNDLTHLLPKEGGDLEDYYTQLQEFSFSSNADADMKQGIKSLRENVDTAVDARKKAETKLQPKIDTLNTKLRKREKRLHRYRTSFILDKFWRNAEVLREINADALKTLIPRKGEYENGKAGVSFRNRLNSNLSLSREDKEKSKIILQMLAGCFVGDEYSKPRDELISLLSVKKNRDSDIPAAKKLRDLLLSIDNGKSLEDVLLANVEMEKVRNWYGDTQLHFGMSDNPKFVDIYNDIKKTQDDVRRLLLDRLQLRTTK